MSESILDKINLDSTWNDFLSRKKMTDIIDARVPRYEALFNDPQCREVIQSIVDGRHTFTIPKKKLISRHNTAKKRAVYNFDEYEMMALRLLAMELYRFDNLFDDCLYSFRRGRSVKNAIVKLSDDKRLNTYYGYKADIHDYFNSIDVERLTNSLMKEIDDKRLNCLFASILLDGRTDHNGEIIYEKKGAMAGVPISAFLANYYLKDVDNYFSNEKCIYMRYADDILILCEDKIMLEHHRSSLLRMIKEHGLEINPKKEQYIFPNDPIEFLGFTITQNCIDISQKTVRKTKSKIRRSARSIRRWMLKKNAPVEGTIRAMIRTYNHKFFGYDNSELTWALWYLPAISTDKSLKEIDHHLQDWIRYIATGRHNKKNYVAVPYEMMVKNGYRTLVDYYHNGAKRKKEV